MSRFVCTHFLGFFMTMMLTHSSNRAGHYNRALEEAVQSHKSQWAKDWESKNPLSGGATFTTMTPTQRVKALSSLSITCCSNVQTY